MHFIDWSILCAYVLVVFSIAISTHRFLKKKFYSGLLAPSNSMFVHYLSGRTLTKFEVLFSIVATEVSALTFLLVPGSVFSSDFSYIRFVIGACIGRLVASKYILPRIYNKGLTIFEILARGINGYKNLDRDGHNGKRMGAALYIFLKIFGVSARLAGGAIILSQLTGAGLLTTILVISSITYIYLIMGGLKTVVRTDVMQGFVFVLGGAIALHVIGQESELTTQGLLLKAFGAGKFNIFSHFTFWEFLLGIAGGFIMDLSNHTIDQEMSQKLLGSESEENAKFSMKYSVILSLIVNILFLVVGATLWSFYQSHPLPEGTTAREIFPHFVLHHFPSPFKGLMVAALLSATMSSLDSAINAMSTCLWNDVFPSTQPIKNQQMMIRSDNLIMTLATAIYASLIGQSENLFMMALNLNYWASAPILGIFLVRLFFYRFIKFTYTWHIVLFTYLFSLICMGLAKGWFGTGDQITLMLGVIVSILFLSPYSWIVKTEKDYYEA